MNIGSTVFITFPILVEYISHIWYTPPHNSFKAKFIGFPAYYTDLLANI